MNNDTRLALDGAETIILPELPISSELKAHRKALTAIAFSEGLEGVKRYKLRHPEASSVRVHLNALAYNVKPTGYDAYILALSLKWLNDDPLSTRSNIAEVNDLNANFATDRFNPANHFSKPLSRSLLGKLTLQLGNRGIKIDAAKLNTLSKIKAAIRTTRGYQSTDRMFGSAGVISGNNLIIAGHSHTIGSNGGRDCIRVTVGTTRCWQRLDMLEAALDLIFRSTGGYPPNTPPLELGELDYTAENAEIDPLIADAMGELVQSPDCMMGELVQSSTSVAPAAGDTDYPSTTRTFADRIAAVVAAQRQGEHSPAIPTDDEIDPLSLPFD